MIRLSTAFLLLFLSTSLLRAAEGPKVLFLIGEREYGTRETLPVFAKSELDPRGVRSRFIFSKSDDRDSTECHTFPGLAQALGEADVLFLSLRRRYPSAEGMAAIRKWISEGKPVIGIRTSSHAFGERSKGKGYKAPKGHVAWNTFDLDVLGIAYSGHYSSKSGHQVLARVAKGAAGHSLLKGIKLPASAVVPSHLYKSEVKNPQVKVLLRASITMENADEPIAWTLESEGKRIFYTSVGGVDDMKLPWVRRMMVNAIYWAAGKTPTGNRE